MLHRRCVITRNEGLFFRLSGILALARHESCCGKSADDVQEADE